MGKGIEPQKCESFMELDRLLVRSLYTCSLLLPQKHLGINFPRTATVQEFKKQLTYKHTHTQVAHGIHLQGAVSASPNRFKKVELCALWFLGLVREREKKNKKVV